MTADQFQNQVLPLKDRMFALAYRLLQNRPEAEDAVQDALVRVWEQDRPLEHYGNLEAFCVTLVRNRCLDRIKYNKIRRSAGDATEVQLSSGEGPESIMEKEELKSVVRQTVRALPVNHREMLILRDFIGYSYDDMAEILGIDLNRVRVGIHRARKALKTQLIKMKGYGIATT